MVSHQKQAFWLAISLAALIQSGALAVPPARSGWDVGWHDEFTGSSLDTSKWTPIFSTSPTNNSLHAYLPSHATVTGGNLVLTSTNVPFQSLPYRSAQVISQVEQRLGRWEVRAQLPTTRGMWPAIWLLPNVANHPWPSGGEIDILENRGDQPNLTSSAFHYGTNPPYHHFYRFDEQRSYAAGSLVNYHDSFHTYAVEWDVDQLRFFVDDVHYYTIRDQNVAGYLTGGTSPMQLVINTAIGGDFLDNPNASTVWPQRFLIDYVHTYTKSETAEVLTFENGGFDAAGGSLGRWSTFGNETPNVRSDIEAVRSGPGSLKLFGQFRGTTNNSGVEQGLTVASGEELRAVASALVRSADSIAGTQNRVDLKIDYYSRAYGAFGSSDYLQSEIVTLANGASSQNNWLQEEIRSTVPTGAVEARVSVVFTQPNNQGGAVHVDDVFFARRGETELTWDGNGTGLWASDRWLGGPYQQPTDFDSAVVTTDRVVVSGLQQAAATRVVSGTLQFLAGELQSNVTVEVDGTVAGSGEIVGELAIDGSFGLANNQALDVSGSIDLGATASLVVDDVYSQPRGTYSAEFVAMTGVELMGQFDIESGLGVASHLGRGYFLSSAEYSDTDVTLSVYAALLGDANGDGAVDVTDFNIWNSSRSRSSTDWTTGDFNGDLLTNTADFEIWNSNKFTTATATQVVPEPSLAVLPLWLFILWLVINHHDHHRSR